MFAGSSAVDNHCSVLRDLVEMLFYFFGRDSNRTRQFLVSFTPRFWVARVYERELFAAVHPFLQFINCDSRYFHRLTFPFGVRRPGVAFLLVSARLSYNKATSGRRTPKRICVPV